MSTFLWNPITGQLDRAEVAGGPAGTINSVTGNVGEKVYGDFTGNVDLKGAYADSAHVTEVTGTPSSALQTFENRVWDTAYVVDASTEVGLRGTFTTIQAALDAAVFDGMDYTNPRKIRLRPGTYTEDLVIPGGAYFFADDISGDQVDLSQPVVIVGQHTAADISVFYSNGVRWVGTAVSIFTAGDTIFSLLAIDSLFFANDPVTFIASSADATIMQFTNCDFAGTIVPSTQKIAFSGGYTIVFDNCRLGGSGITASGVALEMNGCLEVGQVVITTGILKARLSSFIADDGPNVTMTSNTAGSFVDYCSFTSDDATYAIAGVNAALVAASNCVIPASGTGPIDFYNPSTGSKPLALTQQGNVLTSVRQSAIDYVAEGQEGYIGITNTAAPRAVTLTPQAKSQLIYVCDESGGAGTNAITISAGGGATINGAASVVINENYGACLFAAVSPTLFVLISRTVNYPLSLSKGGTNASLTPSNGGMVYSTATGLAILNATITANKLLMSGASGAPAWSTASYPATAGASGTLLQSDGTNIVNSTATYPATAGTTGTILRSNGTNLVNTTATYPATTTTNRILYSSATNTIGEITSVASSILLTNSSGVPSCATSLDNDFTFTTAVAGGSRRITVSNTDNTNSSSDALIIKSVGGTSAGDPFDRYAVGTARSYAVGIDNSDSQAFKVNTLAGATAGMSSGTNLFKVTSAGNVTQVLNAMCRAYVDNAISNVTGDGTAYTVVFDATLFDIGANFNTGTGVFTTPVAGKYQINASVTLTGLGAAHTTCLFRIVGTNNENHLFNPFLLADAAGNATYACSVIMSVGASVSLSVLIQVTGSTKTVGIKEDTNGPYSSLSIGLVS